MTEILIKAAGGIVSTLGFGILFRLRARHLPIAALDGAIACAVYFLCSQCFDSPFLINMLASFATAVFSELFAKIFKAPATVFLLPGCIALVPGGTLYYAMSSLLSADYSEAFSTLLLTLDVGIAIGGGIIAASFVKYCLNFIFKKIPSRKKT